MIPPTIQQAKTLEAIRRLTDDGVPPSYEELGAFLNKSRSQIHYILSRMKERGLVDFEYGRARSIRIVDSVDRIELKGMSNEQLARLRSRIEATMINRWNP